MLVHVTDMNGVFRPKGPFDRIAQPIGLGFGPPTVIKGLKGRPFVRRETVVRQKTASDQRQRRAETGTVPILTGGES